MLRIYNAYTNDKDSFSSLEDSIIELMKTCDQEFATPLHEKVDFKSYVRKIRDYGTFIWDEEDGVLRGFIAGYTDNLVCDMAYAALLMIAPSARRQGLATRLFAAFLDLCREKGIGKVHFFTDGNAGQRALYSSLGAYELSRDEARPKSLHLCIDTGADRK